MDLTSVPYACTKQLSKALLSFGVTRHLMSNKRAIALLLWTFLRILIQGSKPSYFRGRRLLVNAFFRRSYRKSQN